MHITIHEQVNNNDLLYSIGNYIQYLVIMYNEKESEKYIYIYFFFNLLSMIYLAESLYCTPKTNTSL